MRYGKYGNRKVTVDGVVFDSKREAARYKELKLLQEAGEIKGLQMQVPFELIPAKYEHFERFSEKTGKKLKDGCQCKYKAEQQKNTVQLFVTIFHILSVLFF